MRLPSRDSSTGRALATFLQALAGFLAFALVVLRSIDVNQLQHGGYAQAAVIISAAIGIISFLNNLFRKSVPNY